VYLRTKSQKYPPPEISIIQNFLGAPLSWTFLKKSSWQWFLRCFALKICFRCHAMRIHLSRLNWLLRKCQLLYFAAHFMGVRTSLWCFVTLLIIKWYFDQSNLNFWSFLDGCRSQIVSIKWLHLKFSYRMPFEKLEISNFWEKNNGNFSHWLGIYIKFSTSCQSYLRTWVQFQPEKNSFFNLKVKISNFLILKALNSHKIQGAALTIEA